MNELLTPQRYPETKLVPGKDIVRPYDVSAWTLPLMMGVTVERATLPAGPRAVEGRPLRRCRSTARPSPSPRAARRRPGS